MFVQPFISSESPAHIIFIIEQSSTMGEFYRNDKTKADFAANEVNRFISDLVCNCVNGDRVKDWFYISILGHSDNKVFELWSGYLSSYAENPLRIDTVRKSLSDGAGGQIEIEFENPIWLTPTSKGKENLFSSLEFARDLIQKWMKKKSYLSTLIINISGGYNDDWQNTLNLVNEIKNISCNKQSPILFNLFLSHEHNLEFPSLDKIFDKSFAIQYFFELSSYINKEMINYFRRYELTVSIGGKLFSNKGLLNVLKSYRIVNENQYKRIYNK